MKKKRVNPRRRPASAADVDRAKDQARDDAVKLTWSILFTVLADKEGYTVEQMQRVWKEVDKLSDEIAQEYVKVQDLRDVLKHEYGINLE